MTITKWVPDYQTGGDAQRAEQKQQLPNAESSSDSDKDHQFGDRYKDQFEDNMRGYSSTSIIQNVEYRNLAIDNLQEMDRKGLKSTQIIMLECMGLQIKKSADYQNENSSVKQAMHYRRGIDSIHDMINQKLLRAQSLIEGGSIPNCETLEDTYKDMINYCTFAVSWLRGEIDGQKIEERDLYNNDNK